MASNRLPRLSARGQEACHVRGGIGTRGTWRNPTGEGTGRVIRRRIDRLWQAEVRPAWVIHTPATSLRQGELCAPAGLVVFTPNAGRAPFSCPHQQPEGGEGVLAEEQALRHPRSPPPRRLDSHSQAAPPTATELTDTVGFIRELPTAAGKASAPPWRKPLEPMAC